MKKLLLGIALLVGVSLILSGCSLTDKLVEKAGEEVSEEAIEINVDEDVESDEDEDVEGDVDEDAESDGDGGEDVEINVDDDELDLSIETEEGRTAYNSNEIPDGWPEDVPVNEDYTVVGASVVEGTTVVETLGWVAFETDDSVSDVVDWYSAELEAEDWAQTFSQEDTDAGQESAVKIYQKEARILNFVASEKDTGETEMTITLGEG